MASVKPSWSEENFSCPICLDEFSSPVTTPCGHNFCRTCITKFWDENVQCKCPVCNELFHARPDLRVNILLSEMAAQIKKSVRVKGQPFVESAEVLCDVCTGIQLKAMKFCLVCLTSYCQTHLEPHQRVAGLKRHELVEPMDRQEDRMCKKHDRLLKLFCKTEQECVCQSCTETDHKFHAVVPLKEAYDVKTAQLGKIEAEVQHMIQSRIRKIQGIKDTVELSKKDADREIADGVQVFTALKRRIGKCQDDFHRAVKEKLNSTEKQAEDLIKELEQEIKDLTNRSSEVKKLSNNKDHLHFLQAFRSLKNTPPTRDWMTVEVRPPSHVGTLRRCLDQLEETLNMEMKKVPDLKPGIKKYACELTLDPNTAHRHLSLSEDDREVTQLGCNQGYPGHPERFDYRRQAFRSLKNPPPTRAWTTVEVRPPSYIGTLRRSLDQLEETLNMEMKKQRDAAELKRVQQYEVDVTLDPDTAHCCLILSEDGKQAHDGGEEKELPDNPQRFTVYPRVLTRQSFSSGRFYFEVQVKDKPLWRLGVARESINRKFHIKLTSGTGYWVIIFNKGGLIFNDDPDVRLPLRAQLQKVGLFVAYDEGLVSFYDVEARVHIYSSAGCTFREPLYLLLSPGVHGVGANSAPLIISPVNQTD
uniref:Tripartite motif-containing protein 16-like n=1 Tax=Gadus morhua TaxID=8049 RepID=A0A8C5BCN0_GADMO